MVCHVDIPLDESVSILNTWVDKIDQAREQKASIEAEENDLRRL